MVKLWSLRIAIAAMGLILAFIFVIYMGVPIKNKLEAVGDNITITMNITNTSGINATKNLVTQDTIDNWMLDTGLIFGLVAVLFLYFQYHKAEGSLGREFGPSRTPNTFRTTIDGQRVVINRRGAVIDVE